MNYYLLARLDACDDTIWSPVHNNVLLKVDIEEAGDKLAFHWNPYEAWEGDVEYGLMKFFPDGRVEEQALLLDTQIVMVFPHRFNTHCFFVEARAKQKADLISRSNLACIEFEENDIIPNTITPNGDGLNDRFEIPILGNYSNSELRIYNRYGSEIFSSKQYQNDWPEGDIDSGIYYYILIIAGKENLTGYIQIIK